ncbi:hypothetical protein PV721_42440, partial [Streptomyces sp. MB09-01]|nr:hypothetical protein [Streptomyces sp. MB09-01]
MGDRWTGLLYGLVGNEAAPADVLLRLLGHEDEWLRRAVAQRAVLPQEVIEAALIHPDRHVRMALAENGGIDPGQRARLVDDPAPAVHLALAHGPLAYRRRVAPLPDWAYERLLAHPRGLVGHELVAWGAPPAHILAALAHHEHPAFRRAACRVWDRLSLEARERLLDDEDQDVRLTAARQVCHQDEERTAWLVGRLGDGWQVNEVLARGRLTRDLAERVVVEGERLAAIASNPPPPF